MRAASFEYVRPSSLDEALSLLEDPNALPMAGGQSLIPLLNERSLRPGLVVDIGRLPEIGTITADATGLRIGSGVSLSRILACPDLSAWPLLREALSSVASPAVRNRATLAGNLVRASPTSELPVAMVALNAALTLRSRSSKRSLPAQDFFVGPHRTALAPGEIVTAITVPASAPALLGAFEEIAPRAGAPPLACLAVAASLDPDGVIAGVRIVVGGVTGVPASCPVAEAALVGRRLGEPVPAWSNEGLALHPDVPEAAYALVVLPILLERALARLADRFQEDAA
ncbi:FAD binding domain-containing protein [Methylobacterium organophilum]|uniref:6-hydroxypseudooxynicotine dehydrogenase complex subunit alpha n=1 Tax=Methylobacterium organophilum TaxID=410 RepID=A0ABQ4T5J5_METOR|nr:FAD binding domain-containing protein [Methylobacterium organophilum]GJE25372.1 6-hydroxypseudooxynicotine dehydrogenase complex subunit alpha [Methylobacterium organophilum]